MTQRARATATGRVTVVCLRSTWLCLRSTAYLRATTHAQPHTRKPPERRAASDETPVSHATRHTAGASRASAHVPARGTPRPAAARVVRLTPVDSVARVSASTRARSPPGAAAAPRAAQRSRKPGAVLRAAIDRGEQLATRAPEPRRTMPIELTPAAKTSYSVARPLVRATFYTTATPAAQACATRGARSPQPCPLRSRASVRRAPRCRATDVNLDGEKGDHLPGHRRRCDCAGGAVVKMPSVALAARAVLRLARPGSLPGVAWLAERCSVLGESPAPRWRPASGPALSRGTTSARRLQEPSVVCNVC